MKLAGDPDCPNLQRLRRLHLGSAHHWQHCERCARYVNGVFG